MKSFSIVMRAHGVPDGYVATNIRNIVLNSMEELPWDTGKLDVFVEEIRALPDLDSNEPLSEDDATFLDDLREAMAAQRDLYTSTIHQINRRLGRYLYQGEKTRPMWGVTLSPSVHEELPYEDRPAHDPQSNPRHAPEGE